MSSSAASPAAGAPGDASGTVLYPVSTPGSALPAASSSGSASWSLGVLGLFAAVVGLWLLWKRVRSAGSAAPNGARLAIVETRSLGNRQYLVVARYDEKKYLLGVCQGRIDLLAPLESEPSSE